MLPKITILNLDVPRIFDIYVYYKAFGMNIIRSYVEDLNWKLS